MFGLVKKVFGGGKGGVASKAADIADKAFHTSQERTETDQQDLASARKMQMTGHDTWLDVLVDGVNRLIRPGVTLWLIGGWIGWWQLPRPDAIDPFWQEVTLLVLTFWFSGRAILKDLPKALALLKGLR